MRPQLDEMMLALSVLTHAGAVNAAGRRACLVQRRRALNMLERAGGLPAIRTGAERAIRRSCGACGKCEGVPSI